MIVVERSFKYLDEIELSFVRGIGESTDIVSKEMYCWIDQGGYDLTLRPELTAPVIRAYNQHQLSAISPITKLYYLEKLLFMT